MIDYGTDSPSRIPPRPDGVILPGGVTGGNGLAVEVGTGFAAVVGAYQR